MGHSRLGSLPDTKPFRRLVAQITENASVAVVAGATTEAAQHGLELADGDAGLCHTFYLLSQLTLAAKHDDLSAALGDLGIKVSAEPSVLNIVASFTDAVDKHVRQTRTRTDIGEMAQMAAAESLTAMLSAGSKRLAGFETTSAEVKDTIRGCSTQAGFSRLAHDFFSRFTQRYLAYHLSRELANHVGPGKRFQSPAEHTAFVDGLKVHCREAATIIRDFAGGWHSKANFEGGITPAKARRFIHVSLDKLRRELKVRGGRDVK